MKCPTYIISAKNKLKQPTAVGDTVLRFSQKLYKHHSFKCFYILKNSIRWKLVYLVPKLHGSQRPLKDINR